VATLAFDTYKAVKSLREAGFEEVQADAVVAMVGGAMDEHVASKTNIADLRSSVRNEIAGLRADMYRQLWFMATGIVAATVALVKLIP